ncbi:hypothetical protein PG984_012172 [Apiospora sp. TS-2023a]
MRLRLVDRQFKTLVDETIFRHRIFHLLEQDDDGQDDELDLLQSLYGRLNDNGPRYDIARVPLAMHRDGRSQQDWLNYIYSYFITHAMQEQSTQSLLGFVRRVAQAVCELDGNSGPGAVRDCVRELIPLAASRGLLLGGRMRREPTARSLQQDIRTAAVWLGKTTFIKRLVAEGVRFSQTYDDADFYFYSCIFGHPLAIAAIRGDVDMIRILLGALEPLKPKEHEHESLTQKRVSGSLNVIYRTLVVAGVEHGHRQVVEFALEDGEAYTLEAMAGWAYEIPWPDVYERVQALLELRGRQSNQGAGYVWMKSLSSGCVDILRYHICKEQDKDRRGLIIGVARLHETLCQAVRAGDEPTVRFLLEEAHVDLRGMYQYRAVLNVRDNPLLLAVCKGRIAIIRLLLDHGADPNGYEPDVADLRAIDIPPIVLAVAKERIDIFRLLRERGALLHTSWTGGNAMQAARKYGLTSMVDLLVGEGVAEDARPDPPVQRQRSPSNRSDLNPGYSLGILDTDEPDEEEDVDEEGKSDEEEEEEEQSDEDEYSRLYL